jgi:hypothetical protein
LASVFSRSIDATIRQAGLGALLAVSLFAAGFYYYALPSYTRVGYQPEQPVPFSHQIHSGQLGMDCRYCHTNVENSPHATVPNSQTCMNCHNPERANVKGNSPLLSLVRESYKSGKPVEWKRIHKVPEYAYFNHSVHIARGVGCVSCHGQINEMKIVYHDQPLSMGWCLTCHYNAEVHLRPREEATNMLYKGKEGEGAELKAKLGINPPNHCGGCHR